jgi:branched-subunit amino acid transport protein AzlD
MLLIIIINYDIINNLINNVNDIFLIIWIIIIIYAFLNILPYACLSISISDYDEESEIIEYIDKHV